MPAHSGLWLLLLVLASQALAAVVVVVDVDLALLRNSGCIEKAAVHAKLACADRNAALGLAR